MQFHQGSLVVKLFGGMPLLIHWTTLAMAALVSGFSFRPGTWLAVFLIILIHELGHAIAVWQARASVTAVYMDGTGGRCEWTGSVTRKQRLAIVWGGVLAQFLLWVVAAISSFFIHPPVSDITLQLLKTCLGWNLFIIALNLLPVAPLDGHQAWRLLWEVWRSRENKQPTAIGQQPAAKTLKELTARKPLVPNTAPKSEIQKVISQVLDRAAAEHKAKKRTAETKEEQN